MRHVPVIRTTLASAVPVRAAVLPWMDQGDQPPLPNVPGEPTGIVGLRRFPNARFDPVRWNAAEYLHG